MAITKVENQHFGIDTSFVDFNKIYKKATIEIGLGVYITLKPVEKQVVDGEKVVVDKYLECNYTDESSGYTYDFVLSIGQVNQLITLLQTIKGQLQMITTGSNNDSGCSRGIVTK